MEFPLLAANEFWNGWNGLAVLLALIGVLIFGLILLIFFSFVHLWIQSFSDRCRSRHLRHGRA